MAEAQRLRFKQADQAWEFAEIHRLNYATFVDEIPQHAANPEQQLVDPFHEENLYFVGILDDGSAGENNHRLVAMLAVRARRPFSLDRKLADLDAYLPAGSSPCEIRLLAVEREYRSGPVFLGLIREVYRHCLSQDYDIAVISATVRQLRLYRHLGFVPFGPLVGSAEARFQPMLLTRATAEEGLRMLEGLAARRRGAAANFLPGPVSIARPVRLAFSRPAVSHRARDFVADFQALQGRLARLVNAPNVQILLGSGTLANDVIAGQLALSGEPGLLVTNGEFGARLLDHAMRWRLPHRALALEWGAPLTRAALEAALEPAFAGEPAPRWLWAVHCESSTGMLNDLALLKSLAAERGLRLCVDAISSIGSVPVDLSGVSLAAGVSGKGLGGYPGLALVFHAQPVDPAPRALPRYLDLGLYASSGGTPFTHSSNLIYALAAALERYAAGPEGQGPDGQRQPDPFAAVAELGAWLRARLAGHFTLVGAEEHASPAIVTIALPPELRVEEIGEALEADGYWLSYRSRYLLARNWLQICLMGDVRREALAALVARLETLVVVA
jgi:aspartate aminotransferase-like enzyme